MWREAAQDQLVQHDLRTLAQKGCAADGAWVRGPTRGRGG
jgi:hypothetical protein